MCPVDLSVCPVDLCVCVLLTPPPVLWFLCECCLSLVLRSACRTPVPLQYCSGDAAGLLFPFSSHRSRLQLIFPFRYSGSVCGDDDAAVCILCVDGILLVN